ncbi:hypothetical protein SAMN03080601_00887 [Alkalitalea saponilacus]|uniref:Uncharacterized protein n=1 Tax=Alkalitalea saponilacus TaxID=889453 RepID=A0A1T5CNI6_9BACT|nr:hypothetical protein SAMN03080601_00887 [Alkalitalea saponilacus]
MPCLLSCAAFLEYWACFPPQEKDVKKINVFFVKKTVLFERSEFTVFRKTY